MTKEFFYFSQDAKIISDHTINQWIREVIIALDKGQPCWSISSGDTQVFGFNLKYITPDDTIYEINVDNNSGRARVYIESGESIRPYVRPSP